MFAYCNNNPITWCDPTGAIPVLDAFIHREVLKEINSKKKELSYQHTCVRYRDNNGEYTGKWGFCDLYNVLTGEVWELKKNSTSKSCQTSNALIQLEKYTNGRLLWQPDLPLTKPTQTIIEPGHFKRETQYCTFYVDYWSEGNGILRYDYSVSVNTEALGQAAGMIGIAMTALLLMGMGGYAGLGGLALA